MYLDDKFFFFKIDDLFNIFQYKRNYVPVICVRKYAIFECK